MIVFYDHPTTGKLHFRATSGGGGEGAGAVSEYDAPATPADIARNPREHAAYLDAKTGGRTPDARPPPEEEKRRLYIAELETLAGMQARMIERLTVENAKLKAELGR